MPSASELFDRGWEAGLKALAHVKRDLGRDDEGLALYEEAAALDRAEQNMLGLAHTVRHLGDIHRDAGRLADAERCYLEAIGLYEERPEAPPLDVANTLRPLAILREAQGRVEESRELWGAARRIYAQLHVDAGVRECDRHLAGPDQE